VTFIFPNAIYDIEIPFSNGYTEIFHIVPYIAIQNMALLFPNAIQDIEIPFSIGHIK